MTVVSESPICLKILLSRSEMKKYFISYDDILFSDPKVKATINHLFESATNGLEFEKTGKMTIEVFPSNSGGCTIKFTSEPVPKTNLPLKNQLEARIKNRTLSNAEYIFKFENFEDLLLAVHNTFKTALKYKSSLYSAGDRFFLKIKIPLSDKKTAFILNEYCTFSARGERANGMLCEYTNLLIENNAVNVLETCFFGLKSNSSDLLQ